MEQATGSSLPVNSGDLIDGKFEVEEVIGSGGAGIVVAARHLGLGERVAIKFLKPEARKHHTDVARFIREAKALAHLKNEHIARVSDVGKLPDSSPYIVMEFLVGQDLSDLLKLRRRLPAQEAVDFVLQACEALAEAHSRGVIHRDIKPSNLFVTQSRDGRTVIKLLDFGIAKAIAVETTMDVALTHSSTMVGSPLYMSPEQIRDARSVDHRTDIWSMGVLLYELLAGTPPFAAESLTGVVAAVIGNRVPKLESDVPQGLRRVIEKCLEKEPDDRWDSILRLATALEPFGSAQSQGVSGRISAIMLASIPPSLSSSVRDSSSGSRSWNSSTPIPVSTSQIDARDDAPPSSRRVSRGFSVGLALLGAIPVIAAGLWWLHGQGNVKSGHVTNASTQSVTMQFSKSLPSAANHLPAASSASSAPAAASSPVVSASAVAKAPPPVGKRHRHIVAARVKSPLGKKTDAKDKTDAAKKPKDSLLDDTVDTRY